MTTLTIELTAHELALLHQTREDADTGWLHNPRYPTRQAMRLLKLLDKLCSVMPVPAETTQPQPP